MSGLDSKGVRQIAARGCLTGAMIEGLVFGTGITNRWLDTSATHKHP